jgi:hypothetical protein
MELLGTDSMGRWIVNPTKYIAEIRLRIDQAEQINKWDSRKWWRFLKKKRNGYITNWILYALTSRDATVAKERSEARWLKLDREEELAYWRQYLKENKIPQAMPSKGQNSN